MFFRLQGLFLLVGANLAASGQESASIAPPPVPSAQHFRDAFQIIQSLQHPDAQKLGTCTAGGCWAYTTLLTDSTAELTRQLESAIKLTIQGVNGGDLGSRLDIQHFGCALVNSTSLRLVFQFLLIPSDTNTNS